MTKSTRLIKPTVESIKVIDRISKNYGISKSDLLLFYSEVFNSNELAEFFSNTKEDNLERHKWASDVLEAEYEFRKRTNLCTIIPIGVGQISQYKYAYPRATLWVDHVVTTPKQKKVVHKIATLNVDFYLLKQGFLEKIFFFSQYKKVRLEKKGDRRLYADDRVFPLPSPEPMLQQPKEYLQELGIKSVEMKELGDFSKFSSKTRHGTTRYYDLRCFPNCEVIESKSWIRTFKGWNYTTGYIDISDGSHDGLMTDDGRLIPFQLRCWVNQKNDYPKGSIGDAYGVLRLNKTDGIVFDLCLFDVIYEAEEFEDEMESKIPKQEESSSQPKPKSKQTELSVSKLFRKKK